MSLITMPLQLLGEITRRELISATGRSGSPFTGAEQVQDWGGEWWEYDIVFGKHLGREGKKMSAFFAQVGGGKNTFLLRDWSIDQVISGTPVVAGAGQTGNALATTGWAANTTVLQYGDFFALGTLDQTRLYHLTGDVVSNGAGAATLNFVPQLRSSPGNAQAVVVNAPNVHLRLVDGVPSNIRGGGVYSFTATLREAL